MLKKNNISTKYEKMKKKKRDPQHTREGPQKDGHPML